ARQEVLETRDGDRIAPCLQSIERLAVYPLLLRGSAAAGVGTRRAPGIRRGSRAVSTGRPRSRRTSTRGSGARSGTRIGAAARPCPAASRRAATKSGDPLVEIAVQIPLLLLHRLLVVFELLNAAAQLPNVGLHSVEVLRQLNQALVGNDPLDPRDPRLEIVQLHLCRVIRTRRSGAP